MIDKIVPNQLNLLSLQDAPNSFASNIQIIYSEKSVQPPRITTPIICLALEELTEVFKSTYESPENLMYSAYGQNQLPWISEQNIVNTLGTVSHAPAMSEKDAQNQVTIYKLNDEWHIQSYNGFEPKDVGFSAHKNPFIKKAFEKIESQLDAIASCKAKVENQIVSPETEQLAKILKTIVGEQTIPRRRGYISDEPLNKQIYRAVLKSLDVGMSDKHALELSRMQQNFLKKIGEKLSVQPLEGPRTEQRMLGKACGITLIEQIIHKHNELAFKPEYQKLQLKLEALVFGRIEQSTKVAQSQSDSRIQAVALLLNNKPFFMLDMGNVSSLHVTSGQDYLEYPVTLKHADTLQEAEHTPVDAHSEIHVTKIGSESGHYLIQTFDAAGTIFNTHETKVFHECQSRREMERLFTNPENAVQDREFMQSLKKSWHSSANRQFNLGYLNNGGVDSTHLSALDLSKVEGSIQVESGSRVYKMNQYLQDTSVEFHTPPFIGIEQDYKNKVVFMKDNENKLTATYYDANGQEIFSGLLEKNSKTALHIVPIFDYAHDEQSKIQNTMDDELSKIAKTYDQQTLHQQYSLILQLEKIRASHGLFYKPEVQDSDFLKGQILTKSGQGIDCTSMEVSLPQEILDRNVLLKLFAEEVNLFPQAMIKGDAQYSKLQGDYTRELIDSVFNINKLQDGLKNAIENKYKSYREMCGLNSQSALSAAAVLDVIDDFHTRTSKSIITSRDEMFYERLQRGLDYANKLF